MLSNFPVIARGMAGRSRVALWGHGLNFEQQHGSLMNRFKLFYSSHVHWWFAYTDGVANVLAGAGVSGGASRWWRIPSTRSCSETNP